MNTPLQIHTPQPRLAPYVQMLWYWEGYHPPHAQERILPGGMMELVLNLADEPLCITYPDEGCQPHHFYGPLVAGARSRYFVIDTRRPASILAVWFKPGGAPAFFGVSARELHNLHVPLALLWGTTAANRLYEQLLAARSTPERFHLLEAALIAQLEPAQQRHRAVDFALTTFAQHPQPRSIAWVTEQIALSPTRFIQVFSEEVGMTPKRYARVRRFQQAARLMALGHASSWADIAATCGYFDQAHLINDFQAFAGISPTQYAPQSRDHHNNLAFSDSG